MHKNILIAFLLLIATYFKSYAQDPAYPTAPAAPLTIVQAEYFVDTDPGFGNGTPIGLTPGLDIANIPVAVNTGSLIAGIHRLYIRTLNAEGEWAVTSIRSFVVDFDPAYPTAPAAALNVVHAEYFIDTDPGFGNGTPISITAGVDINNIPGAINTGSLIAGVHRLYIRTLNVEGEWAVSSIRSFIVDFDPAYPTSPAAPQNIVQAEYFVDTDPGFGNGTAITLTPGVDIANLPVAANTGTLVAGVHRVYIRTLNTEGEWAVTSIRSFVVNEDPFYPPGPAAPGNIIAAEYFFDTDPGFGNGTAITITPAVNIIDLTFAATTGSLTAGTHRLYIRSLDDWSITSIREFEVIAPPKVLLSGSLTGQYQTLREAFAAINLGGGNGSVTATVVGNTTETQQAILSQNGYTVTVVPEGDRLISGNISDPLILLNAADNVTIDGQGFSGANRLTIRNTNTGSVANAIQVFGGASNNSIKRCTLEGSGTGNTMSTAVVVLNTDNTGDAENNSIDSNYIRPSSASGANNGILISTLLTSNTGRINNTVIQNNRLENIFVSNSSINHGIVSFSNVNNLTIKGNSVYNTTIYSNTVNGSFYYGIRAANGSGGLGSGVLIDSNFVGGTQPLAGGTKMVISSGSNSVTFTGIELSDNSTAVSSVTRNVVRNLDGDIANPTATLINAFIGIRCFSGSVQEYTNNMVGDSLINGSVSLVLRPGSTGGMLCFGHLIQRPVATAIANNFGGGFNVTTSPEAGSTLSPQLLMLQVSGNTATQVIKRNTVGSALAGSISISGNPASGFIFRGLFVSSTSLTPVVNIDSNTVRNVVITNNGDIQGIRYINNTSSASPVTFIANNRISNLSVSGSGGISGIDYFTNGSTLNLNPSIQISDNLVTGLSSPAGSSVRLSGINVQNISGSANRIRGSVRGNTVQAVVNQSVGSSVSTGIEIANDVLAGDSLVVAENLVENISCSADMASTSNSRGNSNGIFYTTFNSITGGTGLTVLRDNVIRGIASASAANAALTTFGLTLFSNNLLVERNKVYNLSNAATSPNGKIAGIYMRSRSDDVSVSLVRNNMIALNATASVKIAGMELGDGAVNAKVYYNSILTEGTVTANSYALFKSATAIADVKNNILYNAAAGSGTPFAVGLETNVNGYTGNNNYFVSPAAVSLGEIGGAAQTIAAWRTATAQDAATEEGTSGVNTNAANLFLNKAVAQLLINTANTTEPVKVSDKGTPLPDVLSDFLGTVRSPTTPDIGAHEFLLSPPLPLTLLSFTGTKQLNDALLQWRTANEINVSRFELQRSENGIDFSTIGTVLSGGNSYTFTDPNTFVTRSVVFYRLKSVDIDGRFTYSAIIRLTKQVTGLLTVFPNPVQNVMVISGLKQGGILRLLTADGRILVQKTVTAETIMVDIGRYAKGMYYLQYQNGVEVQNHSIIKQ